ncbi:MAG: hypothetical protein K2G12_06000 [Prevotella sp.]|nr:hypothetical protein [Prevotella sp.]
MRKTFIIFACALLTACHTEKPREETAEATDEQQLPYAEATDIQRLIGTKWYFIYPEYMDSVTISFSDTVINRTHYLYKCDTYTGEYSYYLCDSIPSEFDFAAVGKSRRGTCMIYYNDKTDDCNWLKILSLTDDSLTLYYKTLDPNSVVGANPGTSYVYRRIK